MSDSTGININGIAAIANPYDAIVVGSGISGRWAAKELTEKGLKVIMMERGRKDVAARIKKHYGGQRSLVIGRMANLTAPLEARPQCQYRNRCWEGCMFGGYFSSAGMVSSACQNPSLTYMALTARAADFAVNELKNGNL